MLDRRDHVDLLALTASLGYAHRLDERWSVDGGVVRAQYRRQGPDNRDEHYTELYLGLTSDRVSTHVYYSPDYLRPGWTTLYGEVDATVARVEKVQLGVHLGALAPLYTSPNARTQFDWRASAARQFGPVELHAALTGGGPGRDYYDHEAHSKTALTFGASVFF
jgi:uncharacterized protein (TIGR02001 family)